MSKQNTLVNISLQQTAVYSPKEYENVYHEVSNQNFEPLPKMWIPLYYITLLSILAGVISLICLFCVDLTHITFTVRKSTGWETDTKICEDECKAINDTFINNVNSMMWNYHPSKEDILGNQIYDTVALAEPFTQKSCTADKESKTITIVTASKSQPELVTSPTFTVYCGERVSIRGVYYYDYTSRIGSYKPKGGARIKHKDYVSEKGEYRYALSYLIITLIPFVMFAIATMCVTFRLRTTSNYNIRRREGCCFCGKNDLSGHVHRLINAAIVLQILIIVVAMPFLFLITAFALWRSPIYETYDAHIEDAGVFLKVVIFEYICQFVALIGVCLIHYFKLW